MAERTRGMGRGLAALLTPAELGGGERESELRDIPLELEDTARHWRDLMVEQAAEAN